MVHMLRQKLKGEKRFSVEFSSWEVFVNDDRTRTFLSLEVLATGYAEVRFSCFSENQHIFLVFNLMLKLDIFLQIRKQVSLVDDVYRLHSLPTFYKVGCDESFECSCIGNGF